MTQARESGFREISEHPQSTLGLPRPSPRYRLGATRLSDGSCSFLVWAPYVSQVEVRVLEENRVVKLVPQARGYHFGAVGGVPSSARYVYRLDGNHERADPASRNQPEGVDGPSQIVEMSDFEWNDLEWRGLYLDDYVLYELHVGAFTPAGTLDAILPLLSDLKSLGVTALELMPVAQFPGTRNWGYDGVFPFAVQNSYGGPLALNRFVNACHRHGLAVVLDVVYNHLGPEGNYFSEFGPYFSDRYETPWGQAINFDGPHSDEVVRFFIENALFWLEESHVDALRLDAVHGIVDRNAQPFLAMLSSAVEDLALRTRRHVYLIAESALNDFRVVTARSSGGYGLDAQWNDDFHHALHSLQTGDQTGYYRDFGELSQLKKAMQEGYVYTGQYSEHFQQRRGSCCLTIQARQFVVFSQNHDQVGNRPSGERSSILLPLEAQKLSAGTVLLSAFLPLLFMGEEYGEIAPFLYFTSHRDPLLADSVRQGRRAEFASEHGPQDEHPDPQSESAFLQSKLNHRLREEGRHRVLRDFYRELLRLRKIQPALRNLDKTKCEVTQCCSEVCLRVRRWCGPEEVFLMLNFGDQPANFAADVPAGTWSKLLDSADTIWMGPGSTVPERLAGGNGGRYRIQPKSLCLFRRE